MPPNNTRRSTSGKSIQHQYAALTRWSREDGKAHAEKMQAGLLDKFRREVQDHDPTVVEPELTRRAECARRAHMLRLAHLSAKARAKASPEAVDVADDDLRERSDAVKARFAKLEAELSDPHNQGAA